ncbi:UNVERIFIED_CONTAM: Pentatricopeptide repeat-containing protein [Sesamum calycinum]|uniref:Pentatricopeptide repeat-containing protein n=1 Tax=Sesamum calycinum TaxID=2727403 RepID=A0AAW2QWJ2_9LAMI
MWFLSSGRGWSDFGVSLMCHGFSEMPTSPAMRISPGRELRAENHKRGRSLESRILYQENEDDLALFNEVQNKERENFLLQSTDNFDDIFPTKLSCFSDYKLGSSIPARGESRDLLNEEGDKSDYDWLITPPETPLFASLDDEAAPGTLAPRGRPRSQPVSISRSPTMEKGYRSGRGSASPHRLSLSPGSSNSTSQSRSRPFSATHSSPPPTLRHPSPSRRLSTPPSKPIPVPRSSTPTPKRTTTGSAGTTAPSRVRGTSPVKTSRGNSASPKIRAWQSDIPGFSSEAPPNLRTSLADRPASYVRGSSPASRKSSRYGRKSMSPTASRCVSSSHSHEGDPFSFHRKGSVASSGDDDDDVDSLQLTPVSSLDLSASRSTAPYPSNSTMSFSKKPVKILSSSAPKRSFDLVRQMDRKAPQNMFRPLLSSVPSSAFYVGKASASHHSLTSRNSSVTNSSDANFGQTTIGAHDTVGSEQNHEDANSGCVEGHYPDGHDEVFVMQQADALSENVEDRIVEDMFGGQAGEIDGLSVVGSPLGIAESCNKLDAATGGDRAVIVLDKKHDSTDIDDTPDTILDHRSLEVLEPPGSIPESLVTCRGETGRIHLDKVASESQHSYSDSSQNLSVAVIEEEDLTFATPQVIKELMDGDTGYQQLQHAAVSSNSEADVSEGAGISLLLKRSSSIKGRIVQSRSFTASYTSYDDLSYARDSINSIRSSIEHSSASASSSVDLGSSRPTDIWNHGQSSGQKSDMEYNRCEMLLKHKRSVSSLSGASSHAFLVPSITPSCHEDSLEVIAADINKEVRGDTDPCGQSLASEWTEAESTCTDIESNTILKTVAEQSSHLMNAHAGDTPVLSVLISEEPASHENGHDFINNSGNSMHAESSSAHSQTSIQEEDATPSSCADRVDVAGVPNVSSLDAISEMEIENADVISADSYSDVDSANSKSGMTELQHNDAVAATVEEYYILHPAHAVHEESSILVEDMGATKARSLTLEEATDAILFCRSIAHNLAYKAADIAIDNENLQVEVLRPTVTFVSKSNSQIRDMRPRNVENVVPSPRKLNKRDWKWKQKLLPAPKPSRSRVPISLGLLITAKVSKYLEMQRINIIKNFGGIEIRERDVPDHLSAVLLYRDMVRENRSKPNHFMFSIILKSWPEVLPSYGVELVQTQIVKSGFGGNPVVQTAILDAYSRYGVDVGRARKVFDEISDRNVVSWTAMISGYARAGQVGNAVLLFEEMPEGIRDTPFWNSIIAGCAQNGLFSEAIEFFRRMVVDEGMGTGNKPNQGTIVCVLSALGHGGMLQFGKCIHGYIYRSGLGSDLFVVNGLIDMYGKCGSFEKSRIVFDKSSEINLASWNSLINCFALHGRNCDAIRTFEDMLLFEDEAKPDEVTFVGLLNACTHGGMVVEGRRYFDMMIKEYGIEPQIEHYGCLIDLLGRSGQFEEAMEVVKGMRIPPDEVIWGSLLNGCKIHGRIDLAEFAVKKLIYINPNNGGYRAILANLYGEMGKWDEAQKVRKTLSEGDAHKAPGCSWIEVDNQVHNFYSVDRSHPKMEEIYGVLECLVDTSKLSYASFHP